MIHEVRDEERPAAQALVSASARGDDLDDDVREPCCLGQPVKLLRRMPCRAMRASTIASISSSVSPMRVRSTARAY
jgi:hypothetical protein